VAGQTPWQTTGPFFHFGLPWKGCADLTGDSDLGSRPDLCAPGHDVLVQHRGSSRQLAQGTRIELVGQVWDNTGAALTDTLIEIWQAGASGRYAHPEDRRSDLALDPNFPGFGRCASDKNGGFRFRTIRPGRVPGPGNTLQAPHIALGMVGPGILKRLVTRVYFSDAPENAEDPILALVPEERRGTLIATPERSGSNVYRFDIHLSGPRETVFFSF
jgi:protocatechuate 3,4-dioxygenase, alpha subunit